jgi:D-3-phosphoglycerate dehydrogenase
MIIAIPDDYQDCVRHLNCFQKLAGHHVQIFNDTIKDVAALAARLERAEALVLTRERTRITADLLERLPRLRVISQTGKLAGHVDLDACTQHGVAVVDGVGDGSPTAELTWALILASRRYLVAEVARLQQGMWQGHLGQQLRGQRLGVWSYGRIGKQVAEFGKVFGMDVWVWGREGSTQRARADGVEVAPSKEAFLAQSDVMTLHLRLSPESRGIVTRDDLARMKKTALVVNTSRAELIAAGALEQALRQGAPGFAAVDVYEDEPVLGANNPLLSLPNALCTPHIGFVEHDNYEGYYGGAFDNILRFISGDTSAVLNPEALRHARQQPSYARQR